MSRSRRSRSGDRSQRDQHELAWRRIDLHLHTPASIDYQDPDITYLDILRKAEARGADMIAFTDHNTVRGYANMWREIEDLELLEALERLSPPEQRRLDDYRRILKHIRVLPGFELTATFGFHILAIFPEGTSIRQIEHTLLELNVPEDRLDMGTSEVGATVDVLTAYETLNRIGALVIPAHVNSTHGVAMQNLPFGGQTKIAFTQSPYIDALEATDLDSSSRRSTARFFNGSKPEYPRRMHIIQGSDAHRLNRDPNRESNLGVCDRMTEVLVPDVSFAALKELFRSDSFNRVRPYRPEHDPYDFIRIARAEGETIVQSFHELVPRRGRLSPVVRDAAAFANGNGGTIYVGISATPKDPVAGVENAPEQARAIAEDLARYITPQITGSIDIQDTDSKQIIVVQIPAGDDMPYAVLPSTIYVRQEGETTVAMRDEIVQLVVDGLKIERGELPELVSEPTRTVDTDPHADAHDEASEPTRSRSSRRRGRGRSSQSHPAPAEQSGEQPLVHEDAASEEPEPEPVASVSPAPVARDIVVCNDIPFPRTGVEVVDTVEADGVIYHAMRDLRNLKIVHNVTRDSARRLWRYAITQLELHPARAEDVTWHGDRGYWKAYKPRGGDVRYNLVYRHDDHLHVFYGVTDEGLDDEWRDVIPPRYLSRSSSNGDEQEDDTNSVVSETPAAPHQVTHEPQSAEAAVAEPTTEVIAADSPDDIDGSAPAAAPQSDIQPVPSEDPQTEEAASPVAPEPEVAAEEAVMPKPVRRRRKPAAAKTDEPAVPDEVAPQAAEEEQPAEPEPEQPKPVRRRRTTTKKAPEAEAAASADEQPSAEATPPAEAEVEAPKPTRRRRPTKKAAEAEASAAAEASPEMSTAAEPAAAAAPDEEPEKPKPVRRRRRATPKAEATPTEESDRPAEE